jgi:hypothetical protein
VGDFGPQESDACKDGGELLPGKARQLGSLSQANCTDKDDGEYFREREFEKMRKNPIPGNS